MTETLNRLEPPAIPSYRPETQSASSLEFEHQQLLLGLVDKGLISREFYNSGELEAFAIDEEMPRATIKHLLVGDESGGAHHLPTIMELGAGNITVASTIYDSLKPNKSIREFRRAQKARDGRAFKALDVRIKNEDGKILIKDGGSTLFPSEWSTEDVLRAVISASQTPSEHIPDKGFQRHVNETNGVRVVAITDDKTGKIIAGFPG